MKCKLCRQREAAWAMQFVGDDNTPTFTVLGWHYRGFAVTKVCDPCKVKLDGKTFKNWAAVLAAVREGQDESKNLS